MQYKPYKKEFDYSYTLGVFPTLELLQHQANLVEHVILHSKGAKNEGCHKIMHICHEKNIRLETNDKFIHRLSKKGNCYAIGIFKKQAVSLSKEDNHIVLVNPGDMGNLGTIIRTVLGFGVKNIAIIKPGVDAYDPKVVRGSMGALFQVNIQYFDNFQMYMDAYDHHIYTFRLDGEKKLHDISVNEKERYAIVFGNESSGLPESYHAFGTGVVIPHSAAIDSMNLSIAVGIATYHFQKHELTRYPNR